MKFGWRTGVRDMIDKVNEKFGEWARIELHTDGSGVIVDGDNNWEESFDGLGELAEILEK